MRRLYLLYLLGLCTLSVMAGSRSLNDAKNLAAAFMQQNSNSAADVTFSEVSTASQSGIKSARTAVPDYYILNADDGNGFVIVSGDDRFIDILGYSSSDSFDPDNIPDGLAYLLSFFSEEMQYAKNYYGNDLESIASQRLTASSSTSIEPLIKTHWGQGYPFNAQVPVAYSGSYDFLKGRASVGCVALAMAQVMNYWQYPLQGQGGTYYNKNYLSVSVNFSNQTYDWSNVAAEYGDYYYNGSWKTGEYTSSQANEVAKICYHAGVLCNMTWNSDNQGSSSTAESEIIGGMVNHLGYNPYAKLILKDVVGGKNFASVIIENLSAGRPLIMGALTSDLSGHCFIIDGYNATTDKFHVNWGWNGYSDSYFALSAMNVDDMGDFNYDQTILSGLQPESEDFGYAPSVFFNKATLSETTISKGSAFLLTVENLYWYDSLFEGYIGIVVYNSDGNVKSSTFSNQKLESGYRYSFTMASPNIPKSMPAGTYTMCLAVKDSDGNITPIPAFYSKNDRWTLTVSSGSPSGKVTSSGYNNLVTGISQPLADTSAGQQTESDTWYTITGTPVAAPSKGIYIRGGKKYIFR